MKNKALNLGLILSSLLGYLEWGQGNKTFLLQAEMEVVSKLFNDFMAAFHPFTILPLLGQLLLLITLFQKQPSKVLTYVGMSCIGLLLAFMFFIGLISLNAKILLSTLPFLALAVLTIRTLRNREKNDPRPPAAISGQ